MAEFQEVMKQWRRMCDKHLCADKQCSAVTYDLICPITISHNGYPCDSGFVDCSPESMAQVEQIVMEWAKEHPEPQYETWAEFLYQDFLIWCQTKHPGRAKDEKAWFDYIYETHIPADIAEKLGLRPKEVANNAGH